jgi:integrase
MVLDIRAQKLLIASPAGAARTRDARRSDELRRRDRGQRPVKFFEENNVRVRFLRPEEEARLAAEMQPEDWVVVEIALYTGLRRGEQFGLRWDHVDFGTGLLTVPRSKHGEARRVPMNDTVRDILRALPSRLKSPRVFPSETGETPLGARNFMSRVLSRRSVGPVSQTSGVTTCSTRLRAVSSWRESISAPFRS